MIVGKYWLFMSTFVDIINLSDGVHSPERRTNVMKAIVVVFVSMIGSLCCGFDFCTIHTLFTSALDIYEALIKYTNDKFPKGK